MANLKVVGLGGSLRAGSRSRAALAVALEGAAAAGAAVELLDLRELRQGHSLTVGQADLTIATDDLPVALSLTEPGGGGLPGVKPETGIAVGM